MSQWFILLLAKSIMILFNYLFLGRFDIKTTIVIDALTSDYINLLRSFKNDFTAESETLHFIRLNNPSGSFSFLWVYYYYCFVIIT